MKITDETWKGTDCVVENISDPSYQKIKEAHPDNQRGQPIDQGSVIVAAEPLVPNDCVEERRQKGYNGERKSNANDFRKSVFKQTVKANRRTVGNFHFKFNLLVF